MSRIIPKLLIVEDEKNTREGIGRALKFDYHVELAENAERGLELLKENRFEELAEVLRRRIRIASQSAAAGDHVSLLGRLANILDERLAQPVNLLRENTCWGFGHKTFR